jgi:hypothetical protein
MFRRILLLVVVASSLAGTGCLNQYSPDPVTRTEQLINQSEDFRQMSDFWKRFWMNDQPSHMTPERVHGGIL